MLLGFPYEVKIGTIHNFFAEWVWANMKIDIIATTIENFLNEVPNTEEAGRISSHLSLLMAAVVSSRCSHTKANNGIPIGADGIGITAVTAQNNLNSQIWKMLSEGICKDASADMQLMVSEVNKGIARWECNDTTSVYVWEYRHRTIGKEKYFNVLWSKWEIKTAK